ncbi:hypothetical protein BLNAU_13457 [Blattamonas nauphoetae]|uniref:Uncharacterized protein n=1 Tax=Blattamonas nauphoetae TaxID=2049346 RepID=A0ABQ9XJQ7_9EUKA|nr:hypothetical protein BLNAU_13457 [Blattamonas nauphoetae]
MVLSMCIMILALLAAQTPELTRTVLFNPQEQSVINKSKAQIFADMFNCPTHDTKALLDCAKTVFNRTFTNFEKEWTPIDQMSQTPIDLDVVKEDTTECILKCALRNDQQTFLKCLPRCERVFEGAAEVEKRKAISSLNPYEPSILADPFTAVAQEMSFLTPLSSKGKKNQRMEQAEKKAQTLLNRRANPPH